MEDNLTKEQIFETEIKELTDRLEILCRQNKIPYFMCFGIETNDTKNPMIYKNIVSTANSMGINIEKDKINDFLKVINGFIVVPFHNDLIIDCEKADDNADDFIGLDNRWEGISECLLD